jgi:hypothetical protein
MIFGLMTKTKVLDTERVLSGEWGVKLVKLHGSLDWFKLKNGNILNLPSYRAKHGKQPVEGEMILYPLHQKDLYLYPWFELFKGFKHDLSKTTTDRYCSICMSSA